MSDPIQELENKLNHVTDLRTEIDLLNDLAWELRDTDLARSRSMAETAFELATSGEFGEQPYPQGLAASLRSLSLANTRASNLNLALSQSFQALTLLEGIPESVVRADVLQGIGISFSVLGNQAEGLEYCFQALKLVQILGDREREASVLGMTASIYNLTGNLEESVRTFEQVLRLNRELGRKTAEAVILNNLAMSYLGLKKYDAALTSSLQALQLAQERGFSSLVITATGTVGEVFVAMENYEQARHYLNQYLTLAMEGESKRDQMWGLILLGEIDCHVHQDALALTQLRQALSIAQELGTLMEQARCHKLLIEVYEKQGDLKQALAHSKLLMQVNETRFNEDALKKVANLQVIHQVETAKRDTEIQRLKTVELQKEIEERKNAQAALELLATTDPLTGLLNRRAFFVHAEREFQRAQQDGRLLSAIVLDLDHFKNINDTYGHAAGDQVLAAAARMVRDNLRETEIVARYGGDEFVILLPGSNLTRALRVAKRLNRKINSKTLKTERGKVTLTISLGIAELDRENCSGLDTLLDHADQALYAAKRAGRNHTATYQDIA